MVINLRKIFDIKKLVFMVIIIVGAVTVASSYGAVVKTVPIKLYFVDNEMLRLLPVDAYIAKTTPEREAAAVLREIEKGRDDNKKIQRIVDSGGGLSVKVKKRTAYVDISGSAAQNPPKTRDLEMLMVYQIVNSLTSIDGIDTVRFTINGNVEKKYAGFVDMRETFIPDYFM